MRSLVEGTMKIDMSKTTKSRPQGGPLNRSPTQRIRFGKGKPRHGLALTFEKSRGKLYIACSDVELVDGFEPPTC